MRSELNLCGCYTDRDILDFIKALNKFDESKELTLNIEGLKFIEVSAMALLLTTIKTWTTRGMEVRLCENYRKSEAFQYMQRMNFFELCNIHIEEKFERHAERNRFVPFETILRGRNSDDEIGNRIASCIAPEQADLDIDFLNPQPQTGVFDGISYSVSELVRNVHQHSGSEGFVSAQHYPYSGLTKIAISDPGVGIRRSFEDSGSPHTKAHYTDLDYLKLAMKPRVSSKNHTALLYGGTANEGVGLALLATLAGATEGSFVVASGAALLDTCGKEHALETGNGFNGTFACFSFSRQKLELFDKLLESAKVENLGENQTPEAVAEEIDGIFR